MRRDLQAVLKRDAVKSVEVMSPAAIRKQPIDVLKFLDADDVKRLKAKRIRTLGDFVARPDLDPVAEFQISSDLLELLICLVWGPAYDPGPPCGWARLFGKAPLDHYATFPGSPFHTHFGPVFYRGRLDGSARVLVIGQDPSTDETLAERILVGTAGQITQNFLSRLGLTRSYLMFNTFLFGVQSSSLSSGVVTATEPTIMAYRNQLFDYAKANNSLTAILAFGTHANTSATNWPGRGSLPIIALRHPTAPDGVPANWNSHFAEAHAAVTPDPGGTVNSTPYDTSAPMPTTDIPRRDLPFGIPSWHGAGGATRSFRVSGAFETQITWTAP